MATIVTRSGKGSPLTNTEVDANFTNLNTELGTKADASSLASYQPLDGDLTSIAGLSGTTGLLRKSAANTFALDTASYLTGITSGQVTTALGFTPYNATNPAGYITSTASITGTAANVTGTVAIANGGTGATTAPAALTALGAYPATNPSGYITSSALSPYALLTGAAFTGAVSSTGSVTAPLFSATSSGAGSVYLNAGTASNTGYISFWNAAAVRQSYIGYSTANNNLIFQAEGSTGFSFNKTVAVTGSVTASVDMRAPIFYDSDNTAYYVNPAATSVINNATFINTTYWQVSTTDVAVQRADARDDATNFSRLHWYGLSDAGVTSNFRHAWYDGGDYINVTAGTGGRIDFSGSATSMHIGVNRIYADNYHPEADKWTTARTLSLSGDATGSVSWDGSANVTLPVAVVNDSHEHSFNSLLNKTGGTGTYTTSGDFRAPVFYDSNNTAYGVDPTGSSSLTNVYADRYFQRASGIPATNLGDPTVTEMALFDRQFNNKTAFYPAANLKFFTSTDGVTWTEYTSFTDGMKKAFLGGDATSGVFIPNATPYFRIELTNNGNYVYLNALYIYWSASGNSSTVKIQKRRASDDAWLQHTNSSTAVAGWPSHLYLPFATIPYISPTSTSSGHFDTINIDFQPTWVNANNIALYNMEVWGGYPAGSRNIYSTDSDKNVTFPTILTANTDVRAPTFYDSNNTGFYFDGAGTSNLNGLTVGGSQAITVANLDDDNRTYSGHFFLQPYYGAGYYMHVYPNGGAGATSTELNIRTWNGSSYTTAQFITSGYSLAAGSYRAPIFYDSDNTNYYVDPAGNSILGGNLTLQSTGSVTLTLEADTDNVTETDNPKIVFKQDGSAVVGRIGYASGENILEFINEYPDSLILGTSNSTDLTINGSGNVIAAVDVRAPIFYDSNDTAYYTNPNSTSNLLGLSVTNRITGSISGDAQRLFNHTGANNNSLQYWNTLDNTTLNPSAGYHYGLRMGHGDADTYYSATIAVDFFADNFYLRRKTGGTDQTWRRFWHNGDSTVSATGDFRAPIFYDSDNTGFYADFASANANAVYTNGGYSISAGDGKGFRFWNSDDYKIYMSASSNATWGGRVSGETTSDYNMYFRMKSGTNRGFVFRNDTTNVAGIDATGRIYSSGGRIYLNDATTNFIIAQAGTSSALYLEARGGGFRVRNAGNGDSWFTALDGTCTATTDFRAPIFYDSANTAFYVDPASTSNLSGLNVNGSAVYRSDWTTRFQSGSDFVDGTLVTTDIPATATNGDSFVIEITGKSYDGSNPPFKVIAQGYIYNDTIINYSGISYAGNFASYIKVFQDGGVLKFWWPRISYWNSFNVNVMTMDAASNGTITRNRVTAIGNSTEPTGTKKQQINLKGFMRNDVSATNSVDVRAPIFYDSNNTGFYVDPNSTSNLSGLTVANTITGSVSGSSASTTGNAATATTLQTARTINGVSFNGSANITVADSTKLPLAGGTMTGTLTMATQKALVASNFGHGVYGVYSAERYQHVWSMGTPYNLPADGLSSGNGGNLYGLAWSYNPNHGYTGSNAQSKAGLNHQLLLMMNGITYFAAGNGVWTSGIGTSTSSWRAPIFYDTDNTGFYLDPNSTSNLSGLTVANTITGSITGNAATATTLQTARTINGVSFNGSANITITAAANGGNAATVSSITDITGLGRNSLSAGVVDGLTTTNFRTTMFGKNDSTYNIATSRWNTPPTGFGGLAAYGTAIAWSGLDTHAFLALNYNSAGAKIGGGSSNNINWSADLLHSSNFTSYAMPSGSSATNSVDVRAPIFYDSNNTGFYLDASSTGTSLNVAGSIIAAGNVTAYSDIRIKANVETIPSALDKLDQIRGVTYTRTDLDDKEQRYAGVIAQEIEKVLPEAVRDLGNIKAVDYNATIGLLIQAVKELRDEVEAMKSRLH
jgi:hypothetical protein